MKHQIKYRAWLIKEKKMVTPSSINFNKGYGGALEIFVDNPKFSPIKDVLEDINSGVVPFYSYLNHTIDIHKKRNGGDDFVLMECTHVIDRNKNLVYDCDILRTPYDKQNPDSKDWNFYRVGWCPLDLAWKAFAHYTTKERMDPRTYTLAEFIKKHDFSIYGNTFENKEF